MPELPSGTVTFLFTDIEGCPAPWEWDQMVIASAVSRHDALLIHAVTANRGVRCKHVGDGVQAVFATAVAALPAAVAFHRARTAAAGGQTQPVPAAQV